MKFTIMTINDSGSGMKYFAKEDFLKEVGLMIDDCIANGGTYFHIDVDADASCFYIPEEDEEEETEEELIKMNKGLDAFSVNVKNKRRNCPHGYWEKYVGNGAYIKLSIDDVDPMKDFGGYYCELRNSGVTAHECANCKECEVM